MLQDVKPLIVTIQREPAPSTSISDVIIGSLGVAGALTLAGILAGGLLGLLLVWWSRRRRVEDNHMPPVSPQMPISTEPKIR
jgi:hypothetical protein